MSNDDLYNLELLSLVAKITQEIDNHTGINDKTLAEFVISLHDQSAASLPAFKSKLKEVGAEFPDSFVENVDRLILSMHPKHKKRHSKSTGKGKAEPEVITEEDKKRRLLPGLALADKEVPLPTPDDVFLAELGDIVAGKKARPRPSEEDHDRSTKRQRRSPSPPRGRRDDRRDSRNGRSMPDERPVLFKIYNGRVSGLKEFGAFVTLEGVAGRAEGVSLLILHLPYDSIRPYRHGTRLQHSNRCARQLCL